MRVAYSASQQTRASPCFFGASQCMCVHGVNRENFYIKKSRQIKVRQTCQCPQPCVLTSFTVGHTYFDVIWLV